jgi:hypothetical protein
MANPPTVRIDAANEKARRGAVLPLPPDVAVVLRRFLCDIPADMLLWPGRWAAQKRAGQFLKRDLEAARIEWLSSLPDNDKESAEQSDFLTYEDSDGRFADFHALRHTFLSRLGRSGASPKVMQKLARHSTVELTLGRYTHVNLHDLNAAVEALPPLQQPADIQGEPVSLKATGTTDAGASIPLDSEVDGGVLPSGLPSRTASDCISVHFPAAVTSLDSAHLKMPQRTKKARKPSVKAGSRADSDEAEREGFEPSVPCGTPVFETGTIGHSVTSPIAGADDRSHPAAAPSVPGPLGTSCCRSKTRAA